MLIEELKRERERLRRIVAAARESLAGAPEGKLRISTSRSRTQCFLTTPDTGPSGIYLTASESELAAQLAQKEYDEKVIACAERRIEAIDNLLGNSRWGMESHRIADIFCKLHPFKQGLVRPYVLPDETFIEQWQNQPYVGKSFRDGDATFRTDRGEQVRSKSEVIIAHALLSHGVPYHYEKPVRIARGETYYPDFTALNKRTRKVYLWEHFGMLDDVDYLNIALGKLKGYRETGYLLGQQLIVTGETRQRPLSSDAIEHNIRTFLL